MDENRLVCMGDFALLRDALSKRKKSCFWVTLGMIDSFFRGVGQVYFIFYFETEKFPDYFIFACGFDFTNAYYQINSKTNIK